MSVKSTVINSIPLWCVDPIVFFELDEALPHNFFFGVKSEPKIEAHGYSTDGKGREVATNRSNNK